MPHRLILPAFPNRPARVSPTGATAGLNRAFRGALPKRASDNLAAAPARPPTISSSRQQQQLLQQVVGGANDAAGSGDSRGGFDQGDELPGNLDVALL